MKLAPLRTFVAGSPGSPLPPPGPGCLAYDRQNRLYAAFGREVQVIDGAGSLAIRLQLDKTISCMAIYDDRLWLAMPGEIRIVSFEGKAEGGFADEGEMGRVTALVVGPDTLVAADADRRQLCRYDREGNFLGNIGADINRRGFLIPNGILSAAANWSGDTFWVANPGKYRLEQYRLTGQFCQKFGRFGNEQIADFSGCCNPTNVAVAPSGDLAVTEKAPPRMKILSASGELLAWTEEGLFEPFGKNLAVAIDAQGQIAVADPPRCQIHIFSLPSLAQAHSVDGAGEHVPAETSS